MWLAMELGLFYFVAFSLYGSHLPVHILRLGDVCLRHLGEIETSDPEKPLVKSLRVWIVLQPRPAGVIKAVE